MISPDNIHNKYFYPKMQKSCVFVFDKNTGLDKSLGRRLKNQSNEMSLF